MDGCAQSSPFPPAVLLPAGFRIRVPSTNSPLGKPGKTVAGTGNPWFLPIDPVGRHKVNFIVDRDS